MQILINRGLDTELLHTKTIGSVQEPWQDLHTMASTKNNYGKVKYKARQKQIVSGDLIDPMPEKF